VVGLLNDVSQILPRPTLVAMATKFGSKLAITQLIRQISPRFLRLTGVFLRLAIERRQSNSTTTDMVAIATKCGSKLVINQLV